MQAPDEDSFVAEFLGSLGSFPPYFLRLGEENRRGPTVLPPHLELPSVPAPSVAAAQASGALLIDARAVEAFAAGHPAGALSIPLRPSFASWLGWLAPHDKPLFAVREPDQDLNELLWQAAKIGCDTFVGALAGGMQAWSAAGLPIGSVPLANATTDGVRVLDIRQLVHAGFAEVSFVDATTILKGDREFGVFLCTATKGA